MRPPLGSVRAGVAACRDRQPCPTTVGSASDLGPQWKIWTLSRGLRLRMCAMVYIAGHRLIYVYAYIDTCYIHHVYVYVCMCLHIYVYKHIHIGIYACVFMSADKRVAHSAMMKVEQVPSSALPCTLHQPAHTPISPPQEYRMTFTKP